MIGQTISHYKILEKLGKGGMGEVYKAEDTKLKRIVALKFLHQEKTGKPVSLERFQREAQAAAALNHPNIVTIYEIDEYEGQTYIAMEYIEGQNLHEKMSGLAAGCSEPSGPGMQGDSPLEETKKITTKTGKKKGKPLEINEIIDITGQICAGLQKAHDAGIIHRDIKPQNILIDKDGRVKILDFGLAKLKGVSPLTKESTAMGTVLYMSPEQTQGGEIDHRTDIWSLGVVLYEILTGELPFKGEYDLAMIYSIINEAHEPVTALRTGVPVELERIINKALSKDSSDRYRHLDDMLVDLRALKKSINSKAESGLPAAGIAGSKIKTPKRKKIVILPFENLGPPEDEYFAAGITEEITSRLAAVSGLGVISRTSAVQYHRKGKTMTQIGVDLGVDYVLEGTVRWHRVSGEKSRVRVTPQLIQVSDDTHIWSERFDRVIEDIFEVQSEIAKHVIKHLNITLLEPEQRTLEARPTKNIDAYNAYLRGFDNLYSGVDYNKESWEMAVRMFKLAIELDPNFTQAYVRLSLTHSGIYWLGHDRTKERLSKAKTAVDRALQLQPELPEAHFALAHYHASCKEHQQALKELSIAGRGLPNDSELLGSIAHIQRDQGRFQEAIDNYKSAADLDPQYGHFYGQLGYTYQILRKYPQAELYLDRSISMGPDSVLAYEAKANNYILWKGDLKKSRATLERMVQESVFSWYRQEIFERNFPAALARISSLSADIIKGINSCILKSQMAGEIYHYMKKHDLARSSFDSARILLEEELKKQPDDPRIHSKLGIVYAGLSRKEEAIREGKLAVELNPVAKDALFGPTRIEELAYIYVIVGEYDIAIDKLDYLLSIPSFISVPILELDPWWDPLRQHPGFQKLLEKYAQDVEEELEGEKDNK